MNKQLMTTRRFTKSNQFGIVSIMVTMVMMIVITLIVLTYSQVIRREQRQTLDRQLSSQAFYVAESAINTANKAIDERLAAGDTVTSLVKSTCDMTSLPAWLTTYAATIPSGADQAVTCLTIDPLSYDLAYSSIGADTTQSVHVKSTSVGIPRLEIAWQAATGAATFGSGSSFPPLGSWTASSPVLRIDLIPAAGNYDSNNLANSSEAYFLYPDGSASAGNTNSVAGDRRGSIINAVCNAANTPKACKATIQTTGATEYYMRIRPIYKNADVVITPKTLLGGPIQLTDGQMTIDATGRSADVLKRISVRRPVVNTAVTPAYAIDSATDICKLLETQPTTSSDACGPLPFTPGVPPSDPPVDPCVRFPGDPCTYTTGRAYWGASIGGNGDPSRHENAPGMTKSLAARRTYWQWNDAINANSGMYSVVRDDTNSNRLPFISIKTPGWASMANGSHDAQIDAMLRRLDNNYGGKPIWLVIWHEPEGGGASGNKPDDPGGAPAWRAMQIKIRQRMTAVGTKHIAFMPILMAYTWNNASGRNPDDWWVPGIWDAYIADIFQETQSGDMFTDGTWVKFVNYAKNKGIPYGTGEWGNRGTDAQTALEMQQFWEWGITAGHDSVIQSYYDSNLNDTTGGGGWELKGQPLIKYRDIMQNDARVRRPNDPTP